MGGCRRPQTLMRVSAMRGGRMAFCSQPGVWLAAWALWALLLGAPVAAAGKATPTGAETPPPGSPAAAAVERTVAEMSDEQVRRLLIDQLKAQAEAEAVRPSTPPAPAGIAGLIDRARALIAVVPARIELLRAGGVSAPTASGIYALLGTGERGTRGVGEVMLSVAAVLSGGLLAQWLFVLYTGGVQARVASADPSGWGPRLRLLVLRAALDLAGAAVFVGVASALFFGLLERAAGQRVLMAASLAGAVALQGAWILSRLLLSPRQPALRVLPFGDAAAGYLHRWWLALVAVGTLGYLACGVVRLAGAGELWHFKAVTMVTLAVGAMLAWMIISRRAQVADALSRGLAPDSPGWRLARSWHHMAVAGVLLLVTASTLARLLGIAAGQGILTLLAVPLYLLLDWLLRGALGAAFDLIEAPVSGAPGTDPQPASKSPQEAGPPSISPATPPLGGLRRNLQRGLRLALALLFFFWVLGIWGVQLPIGRAVVRATFNILLVVAVCYVAYCVASLAIQRRLAREMPAGGNEESEEGAGGGSRIATLLLLLRKFLMVVILVMGGLVILSALGVNIGPLVAGAGVVGLAIGFGAQTLVRDIISGIFFLVDDAFRVGEFVECGGLKGMVEHISIRSLRLRHPRGQVHILPFGDIKNVTNLSRDYVVMKLDFRVRYDADVEKIRKIIKKKVYQPIRDNPELGPKLLEPIKSQGVRELDDSAMVMRVKYKTKPGDQFAIRKEVYRLMQEAFREAGIEFAHRNVTVYVPPEVQDRLAQVDVQTREQVLAGAAAAQATGMDRGAGGGKGGGPGR